MQAIIEKVIYPDNYSFSVEYVELPYFISPWHLHHQEYEIILILEGSGTLFAGDCIRKFQASTLGLIGPKLPHVWLNDKEHYQINSELVARSIVIKFQENFLGESFFEKPELYIIKNLLSNSYRGIVFDHCEMEEVFQWIHAIRKQDGFDKLMSLFRILDTLSKAKKSEYLASQGYIPPKERDVYERIDKVYRFVMNNFQNKLELEEVAKIANLSPTAFCRYFKSKTLKTFSTFLSEIRVGHACKLLIEKKLNISEICYQSGFNFPSNFHKQFKRITQCSPLEYQNRYWETYKKNHGERD